MGTEVHYNDNGWHDGEASMHRLLRVPEYENPTSPGMTGYATQLLHISSLLAVGTLDSEGRPWTTVFGGEPGFARSLGANIIAVKTTVGRENDPVVDILLDSTSKNRALSALGIHLDSRNRVKLSGHFLGGGLVESEHSTTGASDFGMAFAVERSLGNCPKYLNKKTIIPTIPEPVLVSNSTVLCKEAIDLLSKADIFFMSSSINSTNMGTNDRGGPPGFVRIAVNTAQRTTLVYPEYSGNRLYQTLGNLSITPKAGLVIPDFETGDVLYVTGTTEMAHGDEAAHILPRSNLLVKIHLTAARYVKHGLGFRAQYGEPSPYLPPLRYLTSENHSTTTSDPSLDKKSSIHATLLDRKLLSPTIARFRFRIPKSSPESTPKWTAGQYVAFSFEDELSVGYHHMNEDDPRSLNDDYVRTFTVSSGPLAPTAGAAASKKAVEFDITIRNVGTVTSFLFRYPIRSGLDVPLRGFGGTFGIDFAKTSPNDLIPFVAGGIGITPVLAHLPALEERGLLHREQGGFRLFWAVHVCDLGVVVDTLDRFPGLREVTRLFISGTKSATSQCGAAAADANKGTIEKIRGMIDVDGKGDGVVERRLGKEDLMVEGLGEVERWYLCAGKALRKQVLGWLEGKKVAYEDFDY